MHLPYLLPCFAFHIVVTSLILSAGVSLKRRIHMYSMTPDEEGVVLHFCDPPFPNVSECFQVFQQKLAKLKVKKSIVGI